MQGFKAYKGSDGDSARCSDSVRRNIDSVHDAH